MSDYLRGMVNGVLLGWTVALIIVTIARWAA